VADLARMLIGIGLLLVVVGTVLWLLARLGVGWPGRLPGDIVVQRDGFTLYLPIATSLLVSVVLSLLLYFFRR
jgi:hypothetical protein